MNTTNRAATHVTEGCSILVSVHREEQEIHHKEVTRTRSKSPVLLGGLRDFVVNAFCPSVYEQN